MFRLLIGICCLGALAGCGTQLASLRSVVRVSQLRNELPNKWVRLKQKGDTLYVIARKRRGVVFTQQLLLDRPTVLVGCDWRFDSLAGVVVPTGGSLALNRSTLSANQPHQTWQGVYLNDGGQLIGVPDSKHPSRILQAQHGVIAYPNQQPLTVQGIQFERCLTGITVSTQANTQIIHNVFTDCYHAVEMDLSRSTKQPQPSVTVSGNVIGHSKRGVAVIGITATGTTNTGNLTINNNTLKGLQRGVTLQSLAGIKLITQNTFTNLTNRNGQDPIGIRLEKTTGTVVNDNLVTTNTATATAIGLLIENAQATLASCNRFVKLGIGLEAQFDCLNSQLTNNVFRSCSTGVQLTENGVLGLQGTPTTSNNNVWSQCRVGLRSVNSDGRFSQFTVPANDATGVPGYFLSPANGSNIPTDLLNTTGLPDCLFPGSSPCQIPIAPCVGACGFDLAAVRNECLPQPVSGALWPEVVPIQLSDSIGTELYEYWRVATGRLTYPLFAEESRYRACYHLYRRLRDNPGLRQYAELDSFYLSWQETGLERLSLAAEKIRTGDYLTAQLLNAGVEPANLPEVNLQAVNQTCLEFLTQPVPPAPAGPGTGFWHRAVAAPTYSEAGRQTIRAVADQCPLAGGPAVRLARNLRTAFDGLQFYPDSLLCLQAEPSAMRLQGQVATGRTAEPRTTPETRVRLYPNPATDRVTVHYRHLESQAWLQVTTLTGQLIARLDLPDTAGHQTLNTAAWTPGLYLCRIHNPAGQTLHTTKLLITR